MATAHSQKHAATTLIWKATTLCSISLTLRVATTCAFLWPLSRENNLTAMAATFRSLPWTTLMTQLCWVACSSSSSTLDLSILTQILSTCSNQHRSTSAAMLFTLPTLVVLLCLMVHPPSLLTLLDLASWSLLSSVQVASSCSCSSWSWSSAVAVARSLLRSRRPKLWFTIPIKKHFTRLTIML